MPKALTANTHPRTIGRMSNAMGPLLKTMLFTIFVPGIVAGYVPWRLSTGSVAVSGFERWIACVVIVLGVAVYFSTAFWGFALFGGGTPAPIAPTKKLVIVGLHRFVRNPMYIGVALAIGGQAWLFHSRRIAIYLAFVWFAFHLFVLFYEEPALQRQFGGEYEHYRATVPRWIPKLRR